MNNSIVKIFWRFKWKKWSNKNVDVKLKILIFSNKIIFLHFYSIWKMTNLWLSSIFSFFLNLIIIRLKLFDLEEDREIKFKMISQSSEAFRSIKNERKKELIPFKSRPYLEAFVTLSNITNYFWDKNIFRKIQKHYH